MAFVHLDEFPVMFDAAVTKAASRTVSPGFYRRVISPPNKPREKFPKTTKKCRWNDCRLRVFKSMGSSVGLPITSIRRDA
jgi:hypothetical protein